MKDMKIKSLHVEPLNDGAARVIITAEIPSKLALGVATEMLGILNVIATPEPAKEAPAAAEERPTVVGGASPSSAAAPAAEAPGSTETTEAAASAAEPAAEQPVLGGRRRRAAPLPETASDASATPATSPSTPPVDASSPVTRRRRMATEANGAASAASPSASTSAPAPSAPSEISDADLTKAASLTAEKVGPAVVKEVIAGFGVPHVGAIEQAHRAAFLAELKKRENA